MKTRPDRQNPADFSRSKTPVHRPRNPNKDLSTVYLSNLSYKRDRIGVRQLCKVYGEVIHVKVIVDQESQLSKGMAFVEMATPAQAQLVIQGINGQHIDGRVAKANPAIPQVRISHELREEKPQRPEGRRASSEKIEATTPRPKRRRSGHLGVLNDYLAQKAKKESKSSSLAKR